MPLKGLALKAYREKWYKSHKEIIIKRAAEWRKNNPERRKEICKKWLETHHPDKEKREKYKKLYEEKERLLLPVKEFKMEVAHQHDLNHKREARFKKFNIDFDALLEKQNGACAICKKVAKLDIDHCHKSLKVRGLLCRKCNMALGLFHDDVKALETAIKYLLR